MSACGPGTAPGAAALVSVDFAIDKHISLPEAAILPSVDEWLSSLFDPAGIPDTVAAVLSVIAKPKAPSEVKALRSTIREATPNWIAIAICFCRAPMPRRSRGGGSAWHSSPVNEYLSRIDEPVEQSLVLGLVAGPLSEGDPDELWSFAFFEQRVSQAELLEQLYRAVHDPNTGLELAPHLVESKRSHVSWGADHSAGEILFWVANSAASGLAWDQIKAFVRDARGRAEQSGPVDRDDGIALARWTVAERYQIEDEAILLAADETDATGSLTAEFTAPGLKFRVEVAGREGGATVVHVRREIV